MHNNPNQYYLPPPHQGYAPPLPSQQQQVQPPYYSQQPPPGGEDYFRPPPPGEDYYRQQPPPEDYYRQQPPPPQPQHPREDFYGQSLAPPNYYASAAPLQQQGLPPPMYYNPSYYQPLPGGAVAGGGRPPPSGYPMYQPQPPPPYVPSSNRQHPRESRSRSPTSKRGGGAMKPGDVAFSLLIPNVGNLAQQAHYFQNNVVVDSGVTSIVITNHEVDGLAGGGLRRAIKFVGHWPNLFDAQRRVLDVIKLEGPSNTGAPVFKANSKELDDAVVMIPSEKASLLTPERLGEIQSQTQTQIRLHPSQGEIKTTLITIRTDVQDVVSRSNRFSNAQRLIKQVLDTSHFLSDLPSSESEPWCKLYIPVPSRFAGSVIGKNAQIVRDMEASTGARINLTREGTRIVVQGGETWRIITAEGKGDQVLAANRLIHHYLEEAKQRVPPEPQNVSLLRVPLSVPDHLIGVIIGKGGITLKKLQDEFNVRIVIEHNDDHHKASGGKMNRLVEIVGEVAQVELCQRSIVERLIEAVQTSDNRPIPGAPAPRIRSRDRGHHHHHRVAERPPLPSAGGQKEEMTVSVPVAQVGAVIGNKGAMVRQICDESGAKVHIEGKEKIAPDALERNMLITGNSSQILYAVDLIKRALVESNEGRRGSLPQLVVISSTFPHNLSPSAQPQQPGDTLEEFRRSGGGVSSFGESSLPPPVSTFSSSTPAAPLRLFDPDQLSILTSQITKNLPAVGSGNITQIIGSPTPPAAAANSKGETQ